MNHDDGFTGLFCPTCMSAKLTVDATLQGLASVVRKRRCTNGHVFVTEERHSDTGIYKLVLGKTRKSRSKNARGVKEVQRDQ